MDIALRLMLPTQTGRAQSSLCSPKFPSRVCQAMFKGDVSAHLSMQETPWMTRSAVPFCRLS